MTDATSTGELIRQRAAACQKVVDDALECRTGVEEFVEQLKGAGATPAEAADYGRQYTERLDEERGGTPTPATDPDLPVREATPEGLDSAQQAAFRVRRDEEVANAVERANRTRREAVDAAAWKILEAKLRRACGDKVTPHPGSDFQTRLAELLGDGEPSTPSGFPVSVLEAAPHLGELSSHTFNDPHLGQTWRLRRAYEKEVEGVIDGMRGQEIGQPLPRS